MRFRNKHIYIDWKGNPLWHQFKAWCCTGSWKNWFTRILSTINWKQHILKPRAATWKYYKMNHAKFYHRLNIWLIRSRIPNCWIQSIYMIRNIYNGKQFLSTQLPKSDFSNDQRHSFISCMVRAVIYMKPSYLRGGVKTHLLQFNGYGMQQICQDK